MSEYKGFADQLEIETPEQVLLRFPVAGLGSRFLALLTDSVIQYLSVTVVFLLLVLVFSGAKRTAVGAISDRAGMWIVAGIGLVLFLLYWGYYSLFEAYWNGQTPGKKLLKIRVVKDTGRQVTLFESMARNIMRVVDAMPGMYMVGVITMLCNKEHRRLGDLVAGTIVVHERVNDQPMLLHSSRTFTAGMYAPMFDEAPRTGGLALPADGVARLDAGDLNVIDMFFSRALDLDMAKRAEIAAKLAGRMAEKMRTPVPEGATAERLLEAIAHAMRSQGR